MSKILKFAVDQGYSVREFALGIGSRMLKDSDIAGEETVDGKECLVLKEENVTAWIWRDYGIPLKWVSDGEVIKDGEVVGTLKIF